MLVRLYGQYGANGSPELLLAGLALAVRRKQTQSHHEHLRGFRSTDTLEHAARLSNATTGSQPRTAAPIPPYRHSHLRRQVSCQL